MNDSTKETILKKSHKLFADKGFNGVSVREIAKECGVNIAAINYHFKNKENLYIETIRSSMAQTENDIKQLFDELKDKTIESITLAVFNLFKDNAEDLRTGFKLIISSDKYHEAIGEDISKFRGPPGGEYFSKCIIEEFPNANQDDVEWAVRTIFTQVIHKAIIMCNHSICSSMKDMGMGEDLFEKDLLRLVKMVKKELI
jgi:AcrR family transcriptional regulator